MKNHLKKLLGLMAALPLITFGFATVGCDEADDSPAENAAEAYEEKTDQMEEQADELEESID